MANDFTILFVTSKYTNLDITLRNAIDGWNVDVPGTYAHGAWQFVLNDPKYVPGMEFKFVLNGHAWMDGSNLTIGAPGSSSYSEDQVRFTFVIRLDPGPNWRGDRVVIRNSVDGWDKSTPPPPQDYRATSGGSITPPTHRASSSSSCAFCPLRRKPGWTAITCLSSRTLVRSTPIRTRRCDSVFLSASPRRNTLHLRSRCAISATVGPT